MLWYLGQPGALRGLSDDQRLPLFVATVKAPLMAEHPFAAPDRAAVAGALTVARRDGSSRPAPQSSRAALIAQLLTLAATVAVLVWWALRFYLIGG